MRKVVLSNTICDLFDPVIRLLRTGFLKDQVPGLKSKGDLGLRKKVIIKNNNPYIISFKAYSLNYTKIVLLLESHTFTVN